MATGRIFARDDIDEMDNGQTGIGTAFIAGGGYRCRHHWRAIRADWFTAEEWAEAAGDLPQEEGPAVELDDDASGRVEERVGDTIVEAEPPSRAELAAARRVDLVATWDDPANAPALARASLDEFALAGQDVKAARELDPAQLAEARRDLRRIYQETQARLIADGDDLLTVYRPAGDDLLTIEGALDGWTRTKPARGDYITEQVDARRVIFDGATPGWNGPPDGVALLREKPGLRFESGDFDLGGGTNAVDVDAQAERAGTWGVILEAGRENRAARGSLIHIPSGETVLAGAFTRAELREAAADLDRYTDADGLLPTAGAVRAVFDDEVALAKQWAQEHRVGIAGQRTVVTLSSAGVETVETKPTGIVAEDFVDMGGVSFPVVNIGEIRKKAIKSRDAVDKTGRPIERWGRAGSKNTTGLVLIERDRDDFELTEVKMHVRGNFGLYATDSGFETGGNHTVQEWHLVHLATGLKMKSGVSILVEGNAEFPDVGGWRMQEMADVAAELESYLDPTTGAVRPERADDWLDRIAALDRESAPGLDMRDFMGDRYVDADWLLNPITRRQRPHYREPSDVFDGADRMLDDWNARDIDIDDVQRAMDEREREGIRPPDDLSDVPF